MTAAEFDDALREIGSVSELARRIGCDRKAVRRYREGEAVIPEGVAEIVRGLRGEVSPNPEVA